MSKDGTNRGGVRIGAGKKNKSLNEKILEGKSESLMRLPMIEMPNDIPQLKKFMTAKQKNGERLRTKIIYSEIWSWLIKRGWEHVVDNQLLEQYAMSVARWQQCEEYISQYGLTGAHPTTGGEMISVYVKMSQDWQKQINQLRYQIYSAVRDNSSGVIGGEQDSQDVMMESLLRQVK